MKAYIGIDVAKATLDVGLVSERGREHARFENTVAGFERLSRFLRQRRVQGSWVCLEATGQYSEAVADYLDEAGYRVSVVNPAQVRGYAQSRLSRNKTDKVDAYLLAEFCRDHQPPRWTPPPPEWRALRALVRHYEDLTQARQQTANRLDTSPAAPLVAQQLQAHLALLDEQLAQTKQAISDHLDQHPTLKAQKDLLTSIPGIGDLTAGKLLAECRALTDFTNVRQLVAFAGLNPMHHQSGSSIHNHTTISRTGSSALRQALYMPAIVAWRFNPVLRAFAQRLLARGLPKKAIVVALMRKLLHLVFGVLKSKRPFDPAFAS
jgi:transposase